ncbi:hypothetical protein TNCV_4313471 [Trichonephila clavipes]|nr:hypothetical protein TNCV_4313471 [Trichonephila clavipes]
MIKSRLLSELETLMLFALEAAKPLIELSKRTLNLAMNTDAREEQQDTEPRLMQFSHVFLIDYDRGILYSTSVTTYLSCPSWKMMMQKIE